LHKIIENQIHKKGHVSIQIVKYQKLVLPNRRCIRIDNWHPEKIAEKRCIQQYFFVNAGKQNPLAT
jgi:hypothetical protein